MSSYLSNDDDSHSSPITDAEITIHTGDLATVECPTVESLFDPAKAGWITKRGYKIGCIPTWKKRWFVLKGQYLWKFEGQTSLKPKGVPIPVLGSSCSLGPIDPSPSAAANGHKATMILSTIRKEYVIGCESEAELQEWITAIAHAKSLTIKQELGHAPISDSEAFANRSGAYLTQKRIERETDEAEQSRLGRFEG